MKTNPKNESIKRKYFKWLREAIGYSNSTINMIEKSILLYEDFTTFEDYSVFNQKKAIGLKNWLQSRTYKNKPISVTTSYHYLRHLNDFFIWLSGQAGYKSKIDLDTVSYLSLDKKQVRLATAPKPVKFPSLEYVKKLTDSIEITTEIDKRDRALIAFLLLSGMRDKAICTLPICCFDRNTLEINQDPKFGVETKFGKTIYSKILKIDDVLLKYILNWSEYLEKCKLFSSTDPLFPRNKVHMSENSYCFESSEIEPYYWKSTNSIRKILKNRSSKAGLEYYYPHSFRHSTINLAFKACRNAEQIKAISQIVGHENVGTTMMSYGTLDQYRVNEVVDDLNFSEPTENDQEMFEEYKKFVRKIKK
ncbi:MAG: hypothetical protein DRP35_09065 [Candidatus Zixiibacteriota bacterium]|nr:MAG: hypothetical protein DRP35_09065 [candidate division Zixibacteria bacterium]